MFNPPRQTPRGFHDYAEFIDTYGIQVTVRESSAATAPHLWIFVKSRDVYTDEPLAPGMVHSNGSTHLNQEQAKMLRDAIDYWLGEIPDRWE